MNKFIKKGLIYIVITTFCLVISSWGNRAYALSQGPNNGTTFANYAWTGNSSAWVNPSNAQTSNGAYATSGPIDGGANQYTGQLQVTGLGFSIPTSAVVDSIQVDFQAKQDTANNVITFTPTIIVGGTSGSQQGGNAWNVTTTSQYFSYTIANNASSESNLPITPAQVNAANFGVGIVIYTGVVGANANISLDHVRVTVNYTPFAAPSLSTDSIVYNKRTTDAMLSGTISNTNGQAVTAYFRWGTSNAACSSLPNSTSSSSITTTQPASGPAAYSLPVTYNLTGLTANTTYYYCLVGTNASGTTYGSVTSFTTISTAVGSLNSTSAMSPTAFSNTGIGTYNAAYSNYGNIAAADGLLSTCSLNYPTNNYYCSYLWSSGYGFNIPSTATINGVAIELKGTGGLSDGTKMDNMNIQLFKNAPSQSGYIGQRFPNLTTYSQYLIAGGYNDLWGGDTGTITPADVNSSNFGFMITDNGLGIWTESLDHFRVTVYYTLPSTPVVSSPTSASIADTGATLGGTVADQGGSALTNRGVCYALTATNANPQNGGTGVTCVAEGGTAVGAFTQVVSGLTPNSGYSYTAYATNTQGTGYSSASTFTTNGPPTVTTSAASSITQSGATLNSIVDPNNGSTNISYLWGTTAGVACNLQPNTLTGPIGLTGTANISPNATPLSSLSGNTPYYFCVMATNAYGTTYGTVLSLTTSPTPGAYTMMDAGSVLGGGATDCNDGSAAPCPPTGVSAVAASGTQVNVAWSAATGPAATSYDLVWCTGTSCTPGTTITGVTSVYAHTGRTCNTVYGYQLIAKNAIGSSAATSTVYATSGSCSSVPSVTTSTVTNIAATSVTFNSIVNPNGAATNVAYNFGTTNTTCNLLGSQNNIGSIGSGTLAVSPNSANQTGLTAGTTYYYCALATNSNGTTYGSVLSFATTALLANGSACSAGSQCQSGNCYVDADADRYAPSSGSAVCQASTQLAGVDCYDSNNAVNPGATYHSTARPDNATFDWDCNGSISANQTYSTYCTSTGTPTLTSWSDPSCTSLVNGNYNYQCTATASWALPGACGRYGNTGLYYGDSGTFQYCAYRTNIATSFVTSCK